MPSASCPGESDGRGAASRPTSATPRSPTTTSRASCWRRRWRSTSRGQRAAPLVPLPLRARHDRAADLALAQRGAARPDRGTGWSLACVGDPGPFTYKRSRRGDGEIDRAVATVLRRRGRTRSIGLHPARQRRAAVLLAGLRPAGRASSRARRRTSSRSTTPRPTTSTSSGRRRSPTRSRATSTCVDVLERNRRYRNLSPKGEPQLGKRGLYRSVGGGSFTRGPAALGAEPLRRRARPARRSPSARAYRSPRSQTRPTCSWTRACSQPPSGWKNLFLNAISLARTGAGVACAVARAERCTTSSELRTAFGAKPERSRNGRPRGSSRIVTSSANSTRGSSRT